MKVLPLISILMSLEHQSQPWRPRTDVKFGLGFLGAASGWPFPGLFLPSTAGRPGGPRPAEEGYMVSGGGEERLD